MSVRKSRIFHSPQCREGECKDIVHLQKLMDTHLSYMTSQVDEAKRLMEGRMSDFPEQFVKSGEMTGILAKITSEIDTLKVFMHRAEGMATRSALEVVRWMAIGSFVVGVLGFVLRYFGI